MTLKSAKAHLAAVGCTLTKTDGEYRVRLRNAKPGGSDGYYTDSLEDAVETGTVLAARVRPVPAPLAALRANVQRLIAEGAEPIIAQPAHKDFCVASISTKPNSFGLHGVFLVARDGEAWEVGHCQTSPPECAWKLGQVITVSLSYASGGASPVFADCEIPRKLPTAPASVVRAVWATASPFGPDIRKVGEWKNAPRFFYLTAVLRRARVLP